MSEPVTNIDPAPPARGRRQRERSAKGSAATSGTLQRLHPTLRRWFLSHFTALSPAQEQTLPHVLDGKSVLLTSHTGSGKTLAGFLGVFDWLHRARDAGEKLPGTTCIYLSPLRALAYDIEKNLRTPLAEMGSEFITVGVRTGDTSATDRAKLRRKPPHILVTTPESLTLLAAQPTQAAALVHVRFVIVDELHALAENKRGSLLAVALERLEELRASSGFPPLIRIGLSATVAPVERFAEFLCGVGRSCETVVITDPRPSRVEVFSPIHESPYPRSGHTGMRLIAELRDLIRSRRTTLIFTNVRSGAESVGLKLKTVLPELAGQIEVHHASLDRSIRLEVEDRLKRGELRAVVCSSSLELGIDIGSIDTVVMVAVPKGVARALQRLGRSGHSLNETSHGVLMATNINDLAECAVTARMMTERQLEPARFPENPLDVLAQHVVGLAISERFTPDTAYALVRRSDPFRDLLRADFDRIVRYLEGGGVSLEGQYRPVFGKIVIREDGILALPQPRVAREFYQNVGTINADVMIQVRQRFRRIGEVEESFIKRLVPGDVFVLNGRCYRLIDTRLLEANVAPVKHGRPTVPRWNANKISLASGLARAVVQLRRGLAAELARDASGESARAWLEREYDLAAVNAEALVRQFELQVRLSRIPVGDSLLIEVHPERDVQNVFFHSLIGRSANDALSRIVAWRIQETRGGNARATVDDYGFLLSLRTEQVVHGEEWRPLFARDGAEEALRHSLANSSLVKGQFRGVAQTALMVPRHVRGHRRPVRQMQWSTEVIYDVLRRHEPDHPLLEEAYREATLKFLDLPGALNFLDGMQRLPIEQLTTPEVSPFSFGMYASKIRETLMLEDPEVALERIFRDMYERIDVPDHGS